MKRYIAHCTHPDMGKQTVLITVCRSQQHPVRFQASSARWTKGSHLQWVIPPTAARELMISNGFRDIELEEVL